VAAPVKLHEAKRWRRAAVQPKEGVFTKRKRILNVIAWVQRTRNIVERLHEEKAETLEVCEHWQPKLARPKGGKRTGQIGRQGQIG
jgi:hypothetical protein